MKSRILEEIKKISEPFALSTEKQSTLENLRCGLWRVSEISDGKQLSFAGALSVPEILQKASFRKMKKEILEELDVYFAFTIGHNEDLSSGKVYSIIEKIIGEKAKLEKNK